MVNGKESVPSLYEPMYESRVNDRKYENKRTVQERV